MSELINIWRGIGAYNRFAETKLVFFVALCLAILGAENSATAPHGPIHLLIGGDPLILTTVTSLCLLFAMSSLVPQLKPIKWFDWLLPTYPTASLYYFLSIANFKSAEEWLRASTIKISDDEIYRAALLAEQIHTLAKITGRKFSVLKWSLISLFLGWALSWAYACSTHTWPQ